MKRRWFLKSVFAFSCLTYSKSALAGGIPVIDAANLAQAALEAIRALQSNINEAMMIANQVKSLANDLKT